ncbi:hypothetical protein LQZ18_09660 [Lachnospiraceae bacterium ZAX-1]
MNSSRPILASKIKVSQNAVGIIIAAVVFIAFGILFIYAGKETVVIISPDNIQIKALYGLNIDTAEVKAISLIEQSMKAIGIGRKNDGYHGGQTVIGHFISESRGKSLLFAKANSSPTIWIERDGSEDIYISFDDGEKTKAIYRELVAVVPSHND